MNTKQLVALWYAVLVGAAILAAAAFGKDQVLLLLLAVALVAGALIYTLGHHPQANLKRVLAAVIAALLVGLGALYGLAMLTQEDDNAPYQIGIADSVIIVDPTFFNPCVVDAKQRWETIISAGLRNESGRTLRQIRYETEFSVQLDRELIQPPGTVLEMRVIGAWLFTGARY